MPIVLMTGRAEIDHPEGAGERCAVLTKPFLPDSLLEKVVGVLYSPA